MPSIVHEFEWPDRVVVGTVGRPGDRTFYLQVRASSRLVSIVLEKEQAAVLAEKIDEILDGLMASGDDSLSIPADTPVELVDNDPLDEPVDGEFRTGTMALGWDPTTSQITLQAFSVVEGLDDDDDPLSPENEPEAVLLLKMPVGTSRAFAHRTREIVGAGRPLCPFCAQPIDPSGHTCVLPGLM
ncbi:putative repeat protein (TIGR03847 family) [Labedella gwakjiensis]|uniref:DUF3090 family protein n=2 Tax=Actinomycetes TaxID=1760 RepID=A0A2P8GYZ3_9MICO|nr:DUF3090 family protein [Labedella gwakjiensis]PSL39170.1 putative repeat protein (TIGR03847 family) [Labedella gwakjiensis]RUQ86395.1 DUF3090 family protein [Labedella gwakjiensis]